MLPMLLSVRREPHKGTLGEYVPGELATYPFLDFAIKELLYCLSKGLLLGAQ